MTRSLRFCRCWVWQFRASTTCLGGKKRQPCGKTVLLCGLCTTAPPDLVACPGTVGSVRVAMFCSEDIHNSDSLVSVSAIRRASDVTNTCVLLSCGPLHAGPTSKGTRRRPLVNWATTWAHCCITWIAAKLCKWSQISKHGTWPQRHNHTKIQLGVHGNMNKIVTKAYIDGEVDESCHRAVAASTNCAQ
jgi:hypothetical protein